MRKWLLLAFALVGCNDSSVDEPAKTLKSWPEAPEITAIREVQGKSLSGIHNYIEVSWNPIKEALAYKVLMARAEDSTFVVANGTPDGTRRWGIYFAEGGEGICYFRVTAVNSLNESGDTSKAYPFFYTGFN